MTLIVASIDFGTTFSGWAYSLKADFESNPLQISAKQWSGGDRISEKGPTCALIKSDGKTLHSFGFDAENKYIDLTGKEEHESWYFFRRFKMLLFDKIVNSNITEGNTIPHSVNTDRRHCVKVHNEETGIERNIEIEDIGGKRLPAKRVFSLSIKYLKDDVIKTIENAITGLTKNDIHWVLTVPAIWNDAAKQFMREAAVEAGIPDAKLSIALEPECASLYCRHLPVEKRTGGSDTSLASFKAGTKYLVLDAGGGTVDITVHEVLYNGDLKELHKASGGAWGGTKVDDAYGQFLEEITAPGLLERLKEENMEDYVDIFRDFETKKRSISSDGENTITLRTPTDLVKLVEKMTGGSMAEAIRRSKYKKKMNQKGDKLRMDSSVAVTLFERAIDSITDHVSSLLQESSVRGCQIILMVGGFSDSPVLQEAMKTRFPRMRFIVPKEAGLAVLKGAVIFGHSPIAVAERICRFTYGESISHNYNRKCNHRVGKREIDDHGIMRCYGLFRIHARAGQAVKLGEEQKECITMPISDYQTSLSSYIYVSKYDDPDLVTDDGCTKIGSIDVPLYDNYLGRNRKFGISFLFGGTEIEVKVVDKATGDTYKTKVNFLG